MPDATAERRLLEHLNPEQRQAVSHFEGPLLLLAGAGSGKTRVITRRVAWLILQGVTPREILGVTFTNKAAGEMRERVLDLVAAPGLTLATFHSFCARLLRDEHDLVGVSSRFTIYDADDARAAVKHSVKQADLDPQFYKPAEVQRAISNAKNEGLTPQLYEQRPMGYYEQGVASAYHEYQRFLRQSDALDFDDLLLETHELLANHESVRQAWQQRYRFVLIDEYQDTNGLQAEIAHLLAGQHRNLFVTGDPDQAIYSWRGAKVSNILEFAQRYPEAAHITLSTNYRSTPTILKAADHLIAHNEERLPKTMDTANAECGRIVVRSFDDEEDEAIWIARTISDLVAGTAEGALDDEGRSLLDPLPSYADCAVFYRTNAQSRVLELALIHSGIPYRVVRGTAFYQRAEIKDVLSYLRVLHNPQDELSLLRIINTPARGIGKTTLNKLSAAAAERGQSLWETMRAGNLRACGLGTRAVNAVEAFVELIKRLLQFDESRVATLVEMIVEATSYEAYLRQSDPLRAEDRLENLNELITDATTYDHEQTGEGLPGYLERVALIADADRLRGIDGEDDEADGPRVPLLTLHAAKGLEFPVVFLVGLEENILPHFRSYEEGGNFEEERRLCYVGITRAKKKVYLSYAQTRSLAGNTFYNQPSRFLDELPKDCLDMPTPRSRRKLPPARPSRYIPVPPSSYASHYEPDPEYADEEAGEVEDEGEQESHPPLFTDDPPPHTRAQAGRRGIPTQGYAEPPAQSAKPTRHAPSAPPAELPEGYRTIELDDPTELNAGDTVFHEHFGLGTIQRLFGNPARPKAEVHFEHHGNKKILLDTYLQRVVG